MKTRATTLTTFAALSLLGCMGPGVSGADRRFEARLREAMASRPDGPIPAEQGRELLDRAFGERVEKLCLVYGGDWEPGVTARWAVAPNAPVPAHNLKNVGAGTLSLDGLVAVVGVDARGRGHVRRAFLGGDCTDHGGGPVCWELHTARLTVISPTTFFDREGGRALQIANADGDEVSCPLDPGPERRLGRPHASSR